MALVLTCLGTCNIESVIDKYQVDYRLPNVQILRITITACCQRLTMTASPTVVTVEPARYRDTPTRELLRTSYFRIPLLDSVNPYLGSEHRQEQLRHRQRRQRVLLVCSTLGIAVSVIRCSNIVDSTTIRSLAVGVEESKEKGAFSNRIQ